MEANRKLAFLIDGDNAQAALLPKMIAEVSKYGIIKIRRVYGDWSKEAMKSWKEPALTYALHTQQQFSYTSGKNATDMALIIDAMDFLHTAGIDGFCIASSDSDFTPLATRIREKNLFVMGIGRTTTPRPFVNSCDVFVYTENLDQSIETTLSAESVLPAIEPDFEEVPVNVANLGQLEYLLITAFESAVQDDGWAHLGTVGSFVRKLDPAFDPRTYGYKQLSQLVQAYPNFIETDKVRDKSGIYIRLKVD